MLKIVKLCLQKVFALFDWLSFWLWLGTVQHLQEVGCLRPHSLVHVSFRALKVVMQIVAQHADQVDGVVTRLLIRMPWH